MLGYLRDPLIRLFTAVCFVLQAYESVWCVLIKSRKTIKKITAYNLQTFCT